MGTRFGEELPNVYPMPTEYRLVVTCVLGGMAWVTVVVVFGFYKHQVEPQVCDVSTLCLQKSRKYDLSVGYIS